MPCTCSRCRVRVLVRKYYVGVRLSDSPRLAATQAMWQMIGEMFEDPASKVICQHATMFWPIIIRDIAPPCTQRHKQSVLWPRSRCVCTLY